jgi:HK97 family phage major capsid protein
MTNLARVPIGWTRKGRPIFPVAGGDGTDVLDSPTMDLDTTRSRMEAITVELESLAGRDGEPSAEDQTRWDDLNREFDQLRIHRDALIREGQLRRVRQAMAGGGRVVRGTPGGPNDATDRDPVGEPASIERFRNGLADPFDLSNIRTFDRTPEQVGRELRVRALVAVEQMYGMTDASKERATQVLQTFDDDGGTLSRHALITGHPDYLSAWSKMARHTPQMAILTKDEQRAVMRSMALARAMSLADAAGGYLVPFEIDPAVIVTSAGSLSELRQISRTVVATTDKYHFVGAGAVVWSYDAEAAPVSDDTPTFTQPFVDVHMARGFVPISIQALQDESNVTTAVGELLTEGRNDLEAVKFVLGSGIGEPQGVITAIAATDGTGADRTVDFVSPLTAVAVHAVHDALPAKYRSRSSWLANNTIYSLVRQLDTQGGATLWERIGAGRPNELIGRGVYEAEAMDSTISVGNDYLALIGDFLNFLIVDRLGMQVELIPHLFQQATAGVGFGMPTGQRGWFAYVRNGSGVVNTNAFRLLNAPA